MWIILPVCCVEQNAICLFLPAPDIKNKETGQASMDINSNNNLRIGTPHTSSAVKVMMLGSGELGKEVVIEFQRFGVEVIAVDRYENAPAMQVAHRSYTISMLDEKALRD